MKLALVLAVALSSFAFACAAPGDESSESTESAQIVHCMAMPACDEGDHAVASESACLQDDAKCYERTMCGKTITCTGPAEPPPPATCLAIPTCDGKDEQVSGPSACPQDDATCYSRSMCGRTVWCTGAVATSN